MPAAQLLYELGHAQASGVCVIGFARSSGRARVELYRGWVHAIDLGDVATLLGRVPPRGEDALTLLLRRDDGQWSFDPELPPSRRGACAPFHPAAIVRNVVDATLDAAATLQRLGGARLRVRLPPHPSCLGFDERPLVTLLGTPRTLAELEAAGVATPLRVGRLVAFLDAVGALAVEAAAPLGRAHAYALLELSEGASADDVKRAWRRLAHELHPDRHPGASPAELDTLMRRFAEVRAAYRLLV